MSKNVEITVETGKKSAAMTTRTLTYCALLAALQVAMARLFGLMPSEFTRFSIEAIPTILAGVFFGPVAGGLVGFTADLVGCLFSGYGYNPLFCVPPILYGVCGGLFQSLLVRKVSFGTLLLTIAPAAIFGSIFYQSWALDFVYGKGFKLLLLGRSVQFIVTALIEALIINILFRHKLFQRMGIWPPHKEFLGQRRNRSLFRVIAVLLGIVFLIIQVVSILGTLKMGQSIPVVSFDSVAIFFYDLMYGIGYYLPALLGIACLLIAFKEKRNESGSNP